MHRLNNIINSEENKQKFIDQLFATTTREISDRVKESEGFSFTNYLSILKECMQKDINPERIFADYKTLIETKVQTQLTERDERKKRDHASKEKEPRKENPLPTKEKKDQAPAVVSICPHITEFVNTFCSCCPSKELVNDSLQRIFRNK